MGTEAEDRHAATVRRATHEMVRDLNRVLGPTVVATLLGTSDHRSSARWAAPSDVWLEVRTLEPLLCAHQALQTILAGGDDERVARSWFVGANPALSYHSPVQALHERRFADVLQAADRFAARETVPHQHVPPPTDRSSRAQEGATGVDRHSSR